MIRRHGDLLVVALLAAASIAVFETDVEGAVILVIAGLLLVLVLPGYALGRALFRGRDLPGPERILISLALSAAVAVLGTPLLAATSLSLTRHTWPVLFGGVTLASCLAAWLAGGHAQVRLRGWALPRLRDVVLVGVAIAIGSAAIAVGRAPREAPEGVTGYTQLWLTPRGEQLELGVESDELDPTSYRLTVLADGRLVRQWRRLALSTGDGWVVKLPSSIGRSAETVEAFLYKADKPAEPYRRVRIHPDAAAPGP